MDRLLLSKAETIERCVRRAREELAAGGDEFERDFSRQDAAILNLQRACQAAIDMAVRSGRLAELPTPATAREAFELLGEQGLLGEPMLSSLLGMVGFRNVAVHDYGRLNLAIVRHIIEHRLDDLLAFSKAMLKADPSA